MTEILFAEAKHFEEVFHEFVRVKPLFRPDTRFIMSIPKRMQNAGAYAPALPPCVALERRASVLPVVHEQVRHPQLLGVDAHLVDVAVLRPVPRQVVVRPVLSQ